jgi:hypothetical protein
MKSPEIITAEYNALSFQIRKEGFLRYISKQTNVDKFGIVYFIGMIKGADAAWVFEYHKRAVAVAKLIELIQDETNFNRCVQSTYTMNQILLSLKIK